MLNSAKKDETTDILQKARHLQHNPGSVGWYFSPFKVVMVANESERICPFVPVEMKMSSGSVTLVASLSPLMHGAADIIPVSFRTGQLCAMWVMAPDWQASAKTTAILNYDHTDCPHTRGHGFIDRRWSETRNQKCQPLLVRQHLARVPEESWTGLCGHGQYWPGQISGAESCDPLLLCCCGGAVARCES